MKILLSLLLSLSLYAEPLYLQEDKQKHFVGSIAVGGVATGIARYYGSSKFEAMAIGIASALLVGIAKEKWDGSWHGTEDVKDVYADTAGAIVGAGISAQFTWKGL